MRIGLVNVDSKIPNLALMKLSAWHKAQGDEVKVFDPLFDRPDRIYSSKVFKDTDKYGYFHPNCEVFQGGSGYDIDIKLPDYIETMCPDYSLYGINSAMGFTTRGCNRSCGFCIVPRKEGKLHTVADIHQFWRGQERLIIMDNNLTGDTEHFNLICKQVIKHKIQTDFNQGLDIRLIDDEKARLLSKVQLWKGYRLRFAWDSMDLERDVMKGISTLTRYMKPWKLMFYVLIGYDTIADEDLYRVEMLKSLGIRSFVMPYDRTSEYQRDFARYVNGHVYETVAWADYLFKDRGIG
ncbi:MAG: hypothetical protein WA125_16750 [Desulfosporosinus sp.]